MSTTEAPLNSTTDEQSPPSKKRSFLQRLNKRHGTLSRHMRSKRGEKLARSQTDQSSHSRNTSTSQNEVSEAPSLISASSISERKQSEAGTTASSRYYDLTDSELSPTTPTFFVGQEPESEFEVPIRYVVARNDKEGGRDFARGMQDFVHRKQASNASSTPNCPSYAPPLPLGSERRSKSSSSEMSDEQMEKWLQPEDADLHRERKSSENLRLNEQLAEMRVEEQKKEDVEQDTEEKSIVPPSSDSVPAAYPEGWNTDPEDEGLPEEIPPKSVEREKGLLPKKAVRRVAFSQDESRGMLHLPDELLQRIATHLDTNSTWLFRLSCERLYNKIPAPPPPSGTDEELRTFYSHIKSFIPEDLTFCTECKKYHPWTLDDYYHVDSRRRGRSQLCRRHLNAGTQTQEEILGTERFICDSCNTRRSGKRCKTCNKCELCARLKRSWMLMSWVEDECDYCAANHSPKWKHYKGEFEGRLNPGEYREWAGV